MHALAQAVAEGAASAGAEVRLRRVAELAPDSHRPEPAVASARRRHARPRGPVEDLEWADAFAFGTPTRFGAPAAQLKQFIDQAGGLWREGGLADKPVTAFTSAYNRHGGSEATILSLANVFYHWGALIVPPGYTDRPCTPPAATRTARAATGRLPTPQPWTRPGTRAGGWRRFTIRLARSSPAHRQIGVSAETS